MKILIKMSYLGRVLLALPFLLHSLISPSYAQQNTREAYDFVVAADGVWTWYNDERSVFKDGRLYTSYVKKNGKVGLSVTDIKSGATIGSEVELSTWTQKDDHNNAAMLMRNDGKVMAFYSAHIREKRNYFRTSFVDQPTQIAHWGSQVSQITRNDSDNKGATYNNAFQLRAENGKIYNFMRTNNFNPNWKEYSANGTPLRDGKDIILFKNGNGSVRPYVKYASNSNDRIDFFFTDGHPRNANNSLYHCYYQSARNGTRGNLYQTDGTLITSLQSVVNGSPVDVSQVSKLYTFGEDGTNARAWTHSINYDENGHPVVTYSKQININNITYHYARWNGSAWSNHLVTDAGRGLYNGEDDYTGIITSNPYNTNEIFMSSNRNPITGVENNRYEIYSAITGNNGASWNWTEVTKNSPKDNLRPYIPKGIVTAEDRVALWFYGDYITYTNYTTSIVGEYINKDFEAPDTNQLPFNTLIDNADYAIDINAAAGLTQNGYRALAASSGASTIIDGVEFTLVGSNIDSRNRSGAPNDVASDFVFNNPEVDNSTIGVRISGLAAGKYRLNSYHYDHVYSSGVKVLFRELNGSEVEKVTLSAVGGVSDFQIEVSAGKVYEILARENNANNRTRFNGLALTRIDDSGGGAGGQTFVVPGKIEAEDYTRFFDTTSGNEGGAYRSDDVDIEATTDNGGGYNVGWLAGNEWLAFDIEVRQAGEFTADARVASNPGNAMFSIEIDGVMVGDAFNLSSTGGWQSWTTLSMPIGNLSQGKHSLRIQVQNPGFNINWVELKPIVVNTTNTISHSNGAPTTIPASADQSFALDYTANGSRDLFASLFDENWNWLAGVKLVVASGVGTRTFDMTLPTAAVPGDTLRLKIENRPAGAAWNDPDVVQSSIAVTVSDSGS